AVVQDRDGADVAFDHFTHGFEHGLAHLRLVGLLVLDQVADPHFDSPWVRIPSPKAIPGREYTAKPDSWEGLKGGGRKIWPAGGKRCTEGKNQTAPWPADRSS